MTILITSGDYSDYQVHGAFQGTREEAEAFVARLNDPDQPTYHDYMVEEQPDLTEDSFVKAERLTLSLSMYDNGNEGEVRESRRTDSRLVFDNSDLKAFHRISVVWERYRNHGKAGAGELHAVGNDPERVRKWFSDALAALRADDALRAQQRIVFRSEED